MAERRRRSARATALIFAASYALVAGTYILISDYVVATLPSGIGEPIQTVKGLLFVAFTAIVLFGLVLRWGGIFRDEVKRAETVERLLGQVVDTVPVGVLLVSDEGLITFLNTAARSLLGVSAVAAVGRRFDELGIFEDDEPAGVDDLLRRGSTEGLRLRPTESGTARTVLARSAEVDPDHPGQGWVVAVADVTDAQDARERAARLVQGYRYLSQAAMAMSRSGTRRALLDDVARLAVELGGFTAAWVLHQERQGDANVETASFGADGALCDDAEHVAQAYSPDSELLARLVSGEILVSNDLENDPRNPWYGCAASEGWRSAATLALDAPGQRYVVLALFASELGYFDADQVELLRSVRSSLTFALNRLALDRQRLEAEEALERRERSYRTMFEVHPQPMWVYDIETLRFLSVNDSAIAKYGYTQEEFLSMTIADIRPRDEVPRLLGNVLKVSEGLDDAGIWTHVDKSGREFPVHIYSHVLEWGGRHAELVMVQEVARVE